LSIIEEIEELYTLMFSSSGLSERFTSENVMVITLPFKARISLVDEEHGGQ